MFTLGFKFVKITSFLSKSSFGLDDTSLSDGFESRIPWECFQFPNRIEYSITFAITIVNHKSRNLLDTLGFPSNILSLC